MTLEDFYFMVDEALSLILEHIVFISICSQAIIILFCAVILYFLFWHRY